MINNEPNYIQKKANVYQKIVETPFTYISKYVIIHPRELTNTIDHRHL